MITIQELNDLIARKEPLINSFPPAKRARVYEIVENTNRIISWYQTLSREIDKDAHKNLAISDALTNLRELDNQINSGVGELSNMISENDPINITRDPSDAGTVGGNGVVVFRTFGKQFYVPSGALTQDEITAGK